MVKCDNRGSARRGLRFEAPLRHAFGTVEVRDQEDAVNLLVRDSAESSHVRVESRACPCVVIPMLAVPCQRELSSSSPSIQPTNRPTKPNPQMSQGLAARGHVGVYGWSYGGFLACMCLCKAPQTFRVGIAGAPVTSWDGYDTHYTERCVYSLS